jgi:hypothetical protein
MTMPEPGTQKWENMVDFMRKDLENDMAYTKIEMEARRIVAEKGKDFDAEFKKWKEKRNEIHRTISEGG